VNYLRCRLNRLLPARFDRFARAHAEACLRCQAREARRRLIRRELAALAGEVIAAPPHLAAAVLARLGDQGSPDPARRAFVRAAATAGLAAAATAAVLTGLARRRSRLVG
jgi:hypothetical protein